MPLSPSLSDYKINNNLLTSSVSGIRHGSQMYHAEEFEIKTRDNCLSAKIRSSSYNTH